MRVMQAAAMPNLRARSRVAGGSRLTAIEMKTRLSIPRTISIELSVTSRIQVCGSASMARLIERSFQAKAKDSQQAGAEAQPPGEQPVQHQHENRGPPKSLNRKSSVKG